VSATDLAQQRCVPCEGGAVYPLTRNDLEYLMRDVPPGWHLAADARSIERELVFKKFSAAMAFLNRLAALAEAEGHHPDFRLYRWKRVSITLTTHALGGLSRNDLILAAKLEPLIRP